MDDERRWYRYHHLFADLLRIRLREWQPAAEPRLHAAAAAWLEEQGLAAEAIEAALAAGDPLWAAHLVEQNAAGLLARGELAALQGWIPCRRRNFTAPGARCLPVRAHHNHTAAADGDCIQTSGSRKQRARKRAGCPCPLRCNVRSRAGGAGRLDRAVERTRA